MEKSARWSRYYDGRWVRWCGELMFFTHEGLQFRYFASSESYDVELFVPELGCERPGLFDIGDGLIVIILPVVGEPARRDEGLTHRTLVTDRLRQRVGLFVRGTCLLRKSLFIQRQDV